MRPHVHIRPASAEDAEAISTIFNQGITDRLGTLETALRTPAERREWLAAHDARTPVIVAEVDGRVVGWGSLNRFNPRAVYDHVVDFSVYVERAMRGRGIGRRMLEHLIELARGIGYHKMVLATLPHNTPGIALYEHLGFTHVGTYREQGQLDGRWVDVMLMERIL